MEETGDPGWGDLSSSPWVVTRITDVHPCICTPPHPRGLREWFTLTSIVLKFLIISEQESLEFRFPVSPANDVAGPVYRKHGL